MTRTSRGGCRTPRGSDGLTDRQREVVRSIRRLEHDLGRTPSIREIMEATGARSTCTTWSMLRRLQERGAVQLDTDKRWRTVRLLDGTDVQDTAAALHELAAACARWLQSHPTAAPRALTQAYDALRATGWTPPP